MVGALILLVAYFAGVALLGAGIGAAAAHMIWAALKPSRRVLVVILFSIAGALVALALQRYVIIIATAFGGAQTALVGAAALIGDPGAAQAATPSGVPGLSDRSDARTRTGTRPLRRARRRSA